MGDGGWEVPCLSSLCVQDSEVTPGPRRPSFEVQVSSYLDCNRNRNRDRNRNRNRNRDRDRNRDRNRTMAPCTNSLQQAVQMQRILNLAHP